MAFANMDIHTFVIASNAQRGEAIQSGTCQLWIA